ncbi:MAG: hypothetical protein OXL37_05425 [Chloroflexota bacterium]|nr:hypothetical protein [Chloroflexota bacterium]MDE2958740.1 hypothetical protein [Chloroflexota bacterium]
MEDILVIILLVVMVTAGMVLFFGGLAWLGFDAYRSMRRSQPPAEQRGSTGAEAEAFIIHQNQDSRDSGIYRIGPVGDGDSLILIIRKSSQS